VATVTGEVFFANYLISNPRFNQDWRNKFQVNWLFSTESGTISKAVGFDSPGYQFNIL
jgi:hypothetical protein